MCYLRGMFVTYLQPLYKTIFFLFVIIILQNTNAQGFRLYDAAFKSKYLEYPRAIFVYTPENSKFNSQNKKFPVIFFNDGQNLFDPARSVFGQTWELQKTLNNLIRLKLIPPVIVVGIDNTPARVYEYTFSAGEEGMGGGATHFFNFLIKELIPKLEKSYPISDDRTLIGSSLGGLLALFGAITHSESFNRIAALSPSLWWDQLKILSLLSKAKKLPNILYIDSGTHGGERPQDIQKVDKIINRYFQNKLDYKSIIFPQATHDEASWAKRLPLVLQYLYGR